MQSWNGYIMDISNQFDQGVDDLNQQVEKSVGGFSQPIPPTRNFLPNIKVH